MSYSIPDSRNLSSLYLAPTYLRSLIRRSKLLCGDIAQAQYWLAFDLLSFAAEVKWLSGFHADAISEADAAVLELAGQICEGEIVRRDRLIYNPTLHPVAGYVYLLSSPFGYYKIGCSSKPKNRLMNFGVQLPFEVECIAAIYSDDMYRLERQLHERFAAKRGKGEWFTLDTADIEYIKGLT